MKKLLSVTLILFTTFLPAYTQVKSSIQKAYGFVQEILPGTIMVDREGNPMKPPLNISRVIYIEIKGTLKPNIECVQYNHEFIKVAIIPVTITPVDVGFKKESRQLIKLEPANGNTLWKLELLSTGEKQIKKTPEPYKKIILNENKNGRHFKFVIDKEIELASPMSV